MTGIRSQAPDGGADPSASLDTGAPSPGEGDGRVEFVCSDCGYRLQRKQPPERCPTCQGSEWRSAPAGQSAHRRPETAQTGEATAVENSTQVKQQANRTIRDRFPATNDDEPIAFLCECADEACYQAVWLTGQAYDQAHSDPAWHPLVPGHTPATEAQTTQPAASDPADEGLVTILLELTHAADKPVAVAAVAEAVGVPADYADIIAQRLEHNRRRGLVQHTPDGRWYPTPAARAAFSAGTM